MKASLLDRLIDNTLDTGVPFSPGGGISFGQLRSALERDLENLLNSRCFPEDIPESFTEVWKSLLLYGLADLTTRNVTTPSGRSGLCQEIERSIALFEPRLHNVLVRLEIRSENDRRLMFKISALLYLNKEQNEHVNFDIYFDSNRGEYNVDRLK